MEGVGKEKDRKTDTEPNRDRRGPAVYTISDRKGERWGGGRRRRRREAMGGGRGGSAVGGVERGVSSEGTSGFG